MTTQEHSERPKQLKVDSAGFGGTLLYVIMFGLMILLLLQLLPLVLILVVSTIILIVYIIMASQQGVAKRATAHRITSRTRMKKMESKMAAQQQIIDNLIAENQRKKSLQ